MKDKANSITRSDSGTLAPYRAGVSEAAIERASYLICLLIFAVAFAVAFSKGVSAAMAKSGGSQSAWVAAGIGFICEGSAAIGVLQLRAGSRVHSRTWPWAALCIGLGYSAFAAAHGSWGDGALAVTISCIPAVVSFVTMKLIVNMRDSTVSPVEVQVVVPVSGPVKPGTVTGGESVKPVPLKPSDGPVDEGTDTGALSTRVASFLTRHGDMTPSRLVAEFNDPALKLNNAKTILRRWRQTHPIDAQ